MILMNILVNNMIKKQYQKDDFCYLLSQLPGYNCSRCGFNSCELFLSHIIEKKIKNIDDALNLCPFIGKGRFEKSKHNILELVNSNFKSFDGNNIYGVIDKIKADFILGPFINETSCREDIYPLDKSKTINVNDYITYRPLGCPIIHFANVMDINNSILTIKVIGPQNRIIDSLEKRKPLDIGLCIILAFEGLFLKGKKPQVSQTVTFIPNECMMQKVHKGIVVSCEGKKIRLESIDLKI